MMPPDEENNKNRAARRGTITAAVNRSPTVVIPPFSMKFK
jgi:hypothetical protein